MKHYLSIALALVCAALAVSLVMTKRGDNAQHENDAGAIVNFSNQLDLAQIQIATGEGTIITLSNRLEESQSESLTLSNQLVAAESTIALNTEQITNLNRQVATVESENQTLGRRIVDVTSQMTNQIASLTKQITSTEAGLNQANKDYALLENRLRSDVAERVIVERKFNNPAELKAQMRKLRKNPADVISPENIYESLDVEVKSNGTFHVLAPD